MRSVRVTTRETGTVRETARRPYFSLAIISVTVQLRIQVFWVRSVYFNVRNILPRSGTFPPGTPCIHINAHLRITTKDSRRTQKFKASTLRSEQFAHTCSYQSAMAKTLCVTLRASCFLVLLVTHYPHSSTKRRLTTVQLRSTMSKHVSRVLFTDLMYKRPIPVAARSKAWV